MQTEQTPLATLSPCILYVRRTVRNWAETTYDELPDAPKLTRICVRNAYDGDIDGEGWEEYLMLHRSQRSGSFTSMERVIGAIDGRIGSFVLQGVGTYETGVATGNLTIVPGSGTGELTGLRGSGTFVTSQGRSSTITLTCEIN